MFIPEVHCCTNACRSSCCSEIIVTGIVAALGLDVAVWLGIPTRRYCASWSSIVYMLLMLSSISCLVWFDFHAQYHLVVFYACCVDLLCNVVLHWLCTTNIVIYFGLIPLGSLGNSVDCLWQWDLEKPSCVSLISILAPHFLIFLPKRKYYVWYE